MFGAVYKLVTGRSWKWKKVSRDFLRLHPQCEWCGAPSKVAHHVLPVAYYPELELDPGNLLATCGEDGPCHLWGGHCGRWDRFNPLAREHAEMTRECFARAASGRL